jgi:hypothetical protein
MGGQSFIIVHPFHNLILENNRMLRCIWTYIKRGKETSDCR